MSLPAADVVLLEDVDKVIVVDIIDARGVWCDFTKVIYDAVDVEVIPKLLRAIGDVALDVISYPAVIKHLSPLHSHLWKTPPVRGACTYLLCLGLNGSGMTPTVALSSIVMSVSTSMLSHPGVMVC